MSTTRSGNGRGAGGYQHDGYSPGGRNGGRRGSAQYGRQPQQPRGYDAPGAKHAVGPAGPDYRKPAIRIAVAVFAVAVVAVVIAGLIQNAKKNNLYANTFTYGVKINGEDVSGKDVAQYRAQLIEQFQQKINGISVQLTYGDKNWTLTGADLGAKHNVDDVVDRAAKLAREGTEEQRRAEAAQVRAEGREFTAELSLDDTQLSVKLQSVAAEVSVSGRNATVSFNADAMSFKDPEEPTEEELADLGKMFTINPEVAGVGVDLEAMKRNITEDLRDDYKASQALVVSEFKPDVTAETLKKSFKHIVTFRTKISSASTDERVHNIKQALSMFNGILLASGQELSFNDTTGPRTEKNGYQMAHVINDSQYVDDWGGGVCQASTTLYNGILRAGCQIVERGPHSIPSDYVDLGFDAMVNYPNRDLKFKNVSAGNLYIKAWVSPKRNAYVMVFGEPLTQCAYFKTENKTLFEGENPGVENVEDVNGEFTDKYTEKKPYYDSMRPHPELDVETYLIYCDKDGKELKREVLFKDHFDAVKGKRYYPVGQLPTPTPDATATPKATKTPKPH